MTKILVLDTVHPCLIEDLTKDFVLVENYTCSKEELELIIGDYDGLILRSRIKLTSDLIDKGVNLKFIARVGAGMESIDVKYAESKGIVCLNSPEGNMGAVGDHAIGMLLSLMNNLNRSDKQVRQGIWSREENRGCELEYKTVGIIGFGNMGSSFAKKLQGFGCRIIAYDKNKTDYAPNYVEEVDKNTIFEQADVISLHIPLDDENHYLCNEEWFDSFTNNIILINTARGPVVKTDALLEALNSGKVSAAGLDVLEYEETSFEKTQNLTDIPTFRELAMKDNVMFTPHVGGWTIESKRKLSEVLIGKIRNVIQA